MKKILVAAILAAVLSIAHSGNVRVGGMQTVFTTII